MTRLEELKAKVNNQSATASRNTSNNGTTRLDKLKASLGTQNNTPAKVIQPAIYPRYEDQVIALQNKAQQEKENFKASLPVSATAVKLKQNNTNDATTNKFMKGLNPNAVKSNQEAKKQVQEEAYNAIENMPGTKALQEYASAYNQYMKELPESDKDLYLDYKALADQTDINENPRGKAIDQALADKSKKHSDLYYDFAQMPKTVATHTVDAFVNVGQFMKEAIKDQGSTDIRKAWNTLSIPDGKAGIEYMRNEFKAFKYSSDDEIQKYIANYKQNARETLRHYNVKLPDDITPEYAKQKLKEEEENITKENKLEEFTRTTKEKVDQQNTALSTVPKKVNQALGVVSEMVPTIATNTVLPGAGYATMFMESAQSSTEEALRQGATYEQARERGILSGALEVGTEMIGGENVAKLTGIPTIMGKLGLTNSNKIVQTFIDINSEGLEEVVSTIIQPYIDRATINPNAELATAKDIWQAYEESILPTLMFTGVNVAQTGINNYRQKSIEKIQQSNMTPQQKQQEIEEINKGAEELQNKIQSNTQYSLNNISSVRQSANNLQQQNIKIPESTISTFENIQNQRQGLNIEFDTTVQGNGVYNVNEDGTRTVKINPNSPRALEFTLVHELGHDLKAGDVNSYQELQNYILDYAKTKEGYELARQALGDTYAQQLGNGNFNLNDEVANDILGQAIGNQEFLNSLAQNKPNVFQKIYNWFKNVLFDGNKTGKGFADRKFLNDLQNKFRTAYNQAFNNSNISNGNQHSIQTRNDGSKYVKVDTDQNIFEGIDPKDYTKVARMYMQDYLKGTTKLNNTDTANIGSTGIKKYTNPQQQTQYLNEKMQLTPELRNVLEIAQKVSGGPATKQNSKFSNWEYYKVNFEINGIPFEGLVNIGIDKNGNKEFYEINKIRTTSLPSFSTGSSSNTNLINNSIASNNATVNNQSMQNSQKNTQNSQKSSFSLSENSTDNQGRQLTKGQKEYFKNSKVVDENGNLKVVYHGTDTDFNVFDYKYLGKNGTANGKGFYLADDKKIAQSYSNGRIIEAYVDIEKPLEIGKTTISKDEYLKFIEAINDKTNGALFADYGDGEPIQKNTEEYNRILNEFAEEYNYGGDDLDLVSGILNSANIGLQDGYRVLKDVTGYDGIIVKTDYKTDNGETKEYTQYIPLTSEQIKNITNKNPTNNPDIRYSQSNNQWQNFLDKNFDLMPNATRSIAENMQNQIADDTETLTLGKTKKTKTPVEIANMTEEDIKREKGVEYKHKKDKNTPNQRKFFENMESSKIISQQVKDRVDMTSYEKKANEQTLAKVNEKLDENGDKMIKEWEKKTKNFTDEDVALGAILIQRYQQEGDIESAVDVVQKLADMGTEVGRAVQMYSIFQRLTPEAMMVYQQRKLNQVFDNIKQKKTGEWVEKNQEKFKLTSEDAQFIQEQVEKAQNAETERQKQIELAKIESRINDKLPPEEGQSIKALRRMAMLFNPKTQVRNVVGNTLIMPVNAVADFVGTQIDKVIAKKTGVRTTNYTNLKNQAQGFKKGVKESIEDYKLGIRTEPTGSKYEFEFGAKPFNEHTNNEAINTVNRKLNGLNNLLSAVMSGGDRPFYEAAFNNSLQGQMKANNVDTPTSDMIDIAVNEALSRTWNDNNSYTQAVLSIRSAMNKLNIRGFGLGDLIIPFAKTPANLTKAMVEYSPAGYIESLIDFNDMRKAISRGEMTPQQQKKFVSSTSKAIAGTILYAIAGSLVKSGKVKGSKDKDKDVANFEQNVLGIQPYSVKIGDKTYTYSWANPINAPLAIMADTYKMNKENANKFDIITNAFKVAGDTLVDNSFLQGIKELFEADSITEGIANAIEDIPAQFIPTIFQQFANLGDKTKRQTFEYGDEAKTTLNSVKAKIPGLKNTLAPQINTFGEEIQNYGGDNNPLNIFLNPANVSETIATDAQKELYSLYEVTKDKTIFPRQAPYYVSGGGEKTNLSSQDRTEYQKTSGKYVTENLGALFDSDFYKSLDNDKKVEVVKEIISDADTIAKDKWVDTSTTENLAKRKEELGDIPLVDYYNAWIAQKGIESDKNWQGKTITNSKSKKQKQAVDNAISDDLTKEQKERLYGIFNISEKVW